MSECVKVAQLCPTLCDPMGYTVRGILQARILEWVVFPFSRSSSQCRDRTQVSHIADGFFTSWATGKPKNTGVGTLSLLQWISQPRNWTGVSCIAGRFFTNWTTAAAAAAAAKSLQSCPTLCDPMEYTVRGILQARILEWVAFPFSRGSFQPRDWAQISYIASRFFTIWATREILDKAQF